MKHLIKVCFICSLLLSLSAVAWSAGNAPGQSAPQATQVATLGAGTQTVDAALVEKSAQFKQFAAEKIKQLNRNHRLSRSRMQVTQKADGTYQGTYHKIDETSLAVKVRRSSSKTVPFVGILSYHENIFEATAPTPAELSDTDFAVVQIIPNRHLFSFTKGHWQ